nr:hypothetical protein [Deltaproteobacteria bacterium]
MGHAVDARQGRLRRPLARRGRAHGGIAPSAFGAAGSLAVVAGIAVAVAFGETVRGINTMTVRQEITPTGCSGGSRRRSGRCSRSPGRWRELTARLAER